MRLALRRLHRWLGLATAVFLFVAGLTGAVISWDHELDAVLNPELYRARTGDEPLSPYLLADRVEAADPEVLVTWLPLDTRAGEALVFGIDGRIDPATGEPRDLGANQLAVDPATGEEQGRREWGRISLARTDVLPFLYRLHYSMHLPEVGGIDTGMMLMGIVAIVWTIDGFVALWLSFPSVGAWRKSFAFRVREGGVRLLFDVHRSGGVWVWPLLVLLAISAVSMNLGTQVVRPLVALVSPLAPDPLADRPENPGPPVLSRAEAVEAATAEARRRGVEDPPGGVFWDRTTGTYGVGFWTAGNAHGDGGLGNPWITVDAADGRILGAEVPGTGSFGDLFLQAQFPIHSGRILGTPGRVLMTFLGLGVAALSATGVVLWARRQKWAVRSASAQLAPA